MNVCAAVTSAAAAKSLNERSAIVVNGISCPVTCIGPQIVYVTVYRFQWYMNDQDLGAALAPYGRVLSIQYPNFNSRPRIENGMRLVRIEMKSPIPNFLSVRGYKVQCEYRGVKRVCSRCDLEGHNGTDCKTPWCRRCETFGHEFNSCSARCRRCRGDHATADCLRPRSYAQAASDFPELPRNTSETPQATLTPLQALPADIPCSPAQSSNDDTSQDKAAVDETPMEESPSLPYPDKDTSSSEEQTSQPSAATESSSPSDASLSLPSSSDIETEESGSTDFHTAPAPLKSVDSARATKLPRGPRSRGLRAPSNEDDVKPIRREAAKPYHRDVTAADHHGASPRPSEDASLPTDPAPLSEPDCSTQGKDPRLVNPINQVWDLLGASRVDSKRLLSMPTPSDDTADPSKKLCLPASNASPDL